jgi:N-acetylneuraminate synthase
MLGSYKRQPSESERRKGAFRRSIVAAKDISVGDVFTEDMLDYKRPGTGLEPDAVKYILGKKAKRDISYDEILELSDF